MEDKTIATPFKKPYKPKPNFGNKPKPNFLNKDNRQRLPIKKDDDDCRINNAIRVAQVRLVGDNIETPGVYPIGDALKLADELGLDLIEISPNADPPVCRIEDYQKFLYQKKKKEKEQKAKAIKVTVKEVRFGPNTDEHDYQFKLKHAISFLEEGSKVKAYVFFKGRSIMFSQQGEILLLRFANDLEEYGKIDQMPKLEGKRMTIFVNPKPKKKN